MSSGCEFPRIIVRVLHGEPGEIVAGGRYVANLEHPDGSVELRVGVLRDAGAGLVFDIGRQFPLDGTEIKVRLLSRVLGTMLGP